MIEDLLGEGWAKQLGGEFSKDYMKKLSSFVQGRRFQNTVYPNSDQVFNAYKSTPFETVRVCILGQDPYINKGEAHGLSFSTYTGKYTPSLNQLEKAIERDCYNGLNLYWNNNLERWAKQGVFLLNTVLTVDEGNSFSHANQGWETFTKKTIEVLSERGDVVFLLWGAHAKAYGYGINSVKNKVLLAEHPVYAARQQRIWDNGDCFNKCNELIKGDKIIW